MKKVIFTIIFLISLLLISASPNTIRAENSDKKLDLFEFKVTEDFSLGDMNVEEIIQVIYLNDQLSVDYRIFGLPFSPYGHVAVILVKADGSGVYYSFNPTETSIQTIIPKLNNVDGTIDRVELTSINMANFLPGGSGALPSGREYTRFISISVDKDIGNIMLKTAESKCSVAPNLYNLYENNCNTFVQQILNAGKLNFDPVNMIPNYAYNTGVLQWSTYNDYKAGSYDLSTIESIKVSVSNFETNLLNGLLKLSEFSIQTQTGEISTTKSQTSTETSKVATETTVSIPPPGKP